MVLQKAAVRACPGQRVVIRLGFRLDSLCSPKYRGRLSSVGAPAAEHKLSSSMPSLTFSQRPDFPQYPTVARHFLEPNS
jgi:hypothetical protein